MPDLRMPCGRARVVRTAQDDRHSAHESKLACFICRCSWEEGLWARARGRSKSMFKKLSFVLFMAASIGIPYLLTSSSDLWSSLSGQWSDGSAKKNSTSSGKSSATTLATADRGGDSKFGEVPAGTKSIERATAYDLAEVLQFEGTPAWVMSRWPRVSAGLAQLDLQGYRVPLVTGTGVDDLAGSLTYYFDKEQRVAFINFHGSTGDPRKLIALVTLRYSFLKQPTDDPSLGLYQVKWNGKPLSELRIRPARVVRADQPRARFEVDLAMKRP